MKNISSRLALQALLSPLFTMMFLLFAALGFAQAPPAIPYQAVARDNNGALIQNHGISLRFSIRDGAPNGQVVYRESHHPNTNEFGLFSVNIGQGTPDISTFQNIQWGNEGKFAQVELDAGGGSNYVNMGTQPMLSVPYAIHAASCDTALSITETDPKVGASNTGSVPRWNGTTLSDGSIFDNETNIGIGTTSPASKLDVIGTTTTTNLKMTTGAVDGYVLKGDGSGNASWINPTSLSITERDPEVGSSTTSRVPRWNGTTLADGSSNAWLSWTM